MEKSHLSTPTLNSWFALRDTLDEMSLHTPGMHACGFLTLTVRSVVFNFGHFFVCFRPEDQDQAIDKSPFYIHSVL